ncbi:hypothetical protein AAG570_003200 [Ranatra chinensis]|uniref:Uncharacterized protein n=1 Tax=Ranatra chinensis TaxID=642074 RepID=A0ABD0Y776_9HEMI
MGVASSRPLYAMASSAALGEGFSVSGQAARAESKTVNRVEAVAGDPVYLPCDISTKPDAHGQPDAVLLVLWYREDLGTPIYSLNSTADDGDKKQVCIDELRGRDDLRR